MLLTKKQSIMYSIRNRNHTKVGIQKLLEHTHILYSEKKLTLMKYRGPINLQENYRCKYI